MSTDMAGGKTCNLFNVKFAQLLVTRSFLVSRLYKNHTNRNICIVKIIISPFDPETFKNNIPFYEYYYLVQYKTEIACYFFRLQLTRRVVII